MKIQQRNGYQHKDNSAPNFVDIFEYKYRNVNTGAAETEVLGVATNGHLYRRKSSTLSFNTYGVATSVSVYYDEVADTFKCVFKWSWISKHFRFNDFGSIKNSFRIIGLGQRYN